MLWVYHICIFVKDKIGVKVLINEFDIICNKYRVVLTKCFYKTTD